MDLHQVQASRAVRLAQLENIALEVLQHLLIVHLAHIVSWEPENHFNKSVLAAPILAMHQDRQLLNAYHVLLGPTDLSVRFIPCLAHLGLSIQPRTNSTFLTVFCQLQVNRLQSGVTRTLTETHALLDIIVLLDHSELRSLVLQEPLLTQHR